MSNALLNPLAANPDAFSSVELTDRINKLTYQPDDISADLPWNFDGVSIPVVMIDQTEDGIDVLDAVAYNGVPSETDADEPGEPIFLPVPSFADRFTVRAPEVVGRRAVGTANELETFEARLNAGLLKQRKKVSLTWNYQRWGALLGKIRKRDGSTALDLAAKFGVGPATKIFNPDAANANPIKFLINAKRETEKRLGAFTVEKYNLYASAEDFDSYIFNPAVAKAWDRYQDSVQARSDFRKTGFEIIPGVFLKELRGATLPNGVPVYDMPGAVMVPVAEDLFQTRAAPRQDMISYGEKGAPIYVKTKILDLDEGLMCHVESNTVHYLKRPDAVTVIKRQA